MDSILPIIRMSDLQRKPAAMLEQVKDYAVIQSHSRDRAFVLHPRLGRILMESGMLNVLREKCAEEESAKEVVLSTSDKVIADELRNLIGPVLRELSKR